MTLPTKIAFTDQRNELMKQSNEKKIMKGTSNLKTIYFGSAKKGANLHSFYGLERAIVAKNRFWSQEENLKKVFSIVRIGLKSDLHWTHSVQIIPRKTPTNLSHQKLITEGHKLHLDRSSKPKWVLCMTLSIVLLVLPHKSKNLYCLTK